MRVSPLPCTTHILAIRAEQSDDTGEEANGFYLVERGMLRAEYDLPQGWLCESIVAGTTCGELPFFSETDRTATAQVERDCVVWLMDKEGWRKLEKEQPDIAKELLRISLKLTTERMSAIQHHILLQVVTNETCPKECDKQRGSY